MISSDPYEYNINYLALSKDCFICFLNQSHDLNFSTFVYKVLRIPNLIDAEWKKKKKLDFFFN